MLSEPAAEGRFVAEGGGDHGAGVVDGGGEFADWSRERVEEVSHVGKGWLSCQRCVVARLRKGAKTDIRRRVASRSGRSSSFSNACNPLVTPVSPSGTQSAK